MIVNLAVRGLQIIFATVLLALSIVLIKDYGPGHGPSLFDYGAFCGGAGLVFALIGIVACFVESIQGIIMLVLDGLATLFTVAGGIAYAATLKVGSCTDTSDFGYLYHHAKTFAPSGNKIYPGVGDNRNKYAKAVVNDIEGRCKEAQASTAFVWFLFATFAATLVLSFLGGKGRARGPMV